MKKDKVLIVATCSVFAAAALSGVAQASKITSINQAKNRALKEIKNATVVDVDSDYDDGTHVYEVDLLKGNKKYTIVYRASDGKKIEYIWDLKNYYAENNGSISENKCQNLALQEVPNADVMSIVSSTDDGMLVYEVKLNKGNKRYTLEYHASTGKLTKYKWKLVSNAAAGDNNNGNIGKNKAQSIALNRVPDARVISVKFDTDDGRDIYEVDMMDNKFEYDIKIDAKTGQIIEFDQDDFD